MRNAFDWRGRRFAKGAWVLLDLYGTNHDARIWGDPEVFRPERFREWDGSAFDFIHQGGGDHHEGYRCAGEWITIELMKVAVRFLTGSMRYDVPEQGLGISLSRMPAVPENRFVISGVRRSEDKTLSVIAVSRSSRVPRADSRCETYSTFHSNFGCERPQRSPLNFGV